MAAAPCISRLGAWEGYEVDGDEEMRRHGVAWCVIRLKPLARARRQCRACETSWNCPLPTARAGGPAQVEGLVAGPLTRVPDSRFKDLQVWIDTPDKVFAEYSVEAAVPASGNVYRQTCAGVLIAENGKIKRLRETLDAAVAVAAFK
ncbi:MAG TPA: nuclear transport factor 2 family protein [Roseateles sp.]|uniref:nuclear transport factor 2 family protein n=1 Tax=Roseateles sp. TaxID=1971397 RepID=UPI002EDB9F86